MKIESNMKELRRMTLGVETFPPEMLKWIAKENLWNLWVPKAYGGLEMSLAEGLKKLKDLARVDGSLGWTITLCSGANYFIGNLQKEVAEQIFRKPDIPVCFGGSGSVGGTAEVQGDNYIISGVWPYATGAPYLTHFTLNAEITENGESLRNGDNSPLVRSFLIPQNDVYIVEDWNAMGLKASATHSFEVKKILVNKKYSFIYNQVYLPQAIFKIDFSVFAALTLWVNYIGMAEHFLEEARANSTRINLSLLELAITCSNNQVKRFAKASEKVINEKPEFTESFGPDIYKEAGESIRSLTREIIKIYPLLGIKASKINFPLNQVFRDYFTATQHHIFTKATS